MNGEAHLVTFGDDLMELRAEISLAQGSAARVLSRKSRMARRMRKEQQARSKDLERPSPLRRDRDGRW